MLFRSLEPKLAVRAGGMLDPFSLRQSADSIRAAYAEKGYFSAQISDSLIESGDKYAVRFIIEEGRKIRVKDILVSGNQAAKRGEIIGAMKKTKPRGWTLVWKAIPWWRSGSFNQDSLSQDLRHVERMYKNRGHLEVAVAQDSLTYNAKMDRVTIHLEIGRAHV